MDRISALAVGAFAHPAVLLYPTSVQNRTTTAAGKEERHLETVSISEGNPAGFRNSEKSNHRPLWQLKKNFIGKSTIFAAPVMGIQSHQRMRCTKQI